MDDHHLKAYTNTFTKKILIKVLLVAFSLWSLTLFFFYQDANSDLSTSLAKNHLDTKKTVNIHLKRSREELTRIVENISSIYTSAYLDKKSKLDLIKEIDDGWRAVSGKKSLFAMSFYDGNGALIKSWGRMYTQHEQKLLARHYLITPVLHTDMLSFIACDESCFIYVIKPIIAFRLDTGVLLVKQAIDTSIQNVFQDRQQDLFLLTKHRNDDSPIQINGESFYIDSRSNHVLDLKQVVESLDNAPQLDQLSIYSLEGSERSLFITPIESKNTTSETPYLAITDDISNVLSNHYQSLYNMFMGAALVLFAVFISLYILLARPLSQITELSRIISIIGNGRFKQAHDELIKLPDISKNDELEGLQVSTLLLARNMEKLHLQIDEKSESLRRLANHDPLTGLFNRRKFTELLEVAYKTHDSFYLVVLDIDHFKLINDKCGHLAGDKVLQVVASTIESVFGHDEHFYARAGGDEFYVILMSVDRTEAELLMQCFIQLIRDSEFSDVDLSIQLSVSIGIAHYPNDSEHLEVLFAYADAAMYENKRSRLGSYHFYQGNETLIRDINEIQYWNALIKQKLEAQQINVFFQSIHDTTTLDICFHEVLARVNNGKSLIAPGCFIETLEHSHQIIDFDKYMIGKALSFFKASAVKPNLMINLSAITINFKGIDRYILDQAHKNHFPPEKIVIEITEQSGLESMDETLKFMNQLRCHGVRFALDDFGTGYASLRYLQVLPVDFLKLDKSLTASIDRDVKSRELAKALIALAKSLDMRVIAEGVETRSTQRVAGVLGVDYLQGYLFSYPEPNIRVDCLQTQH